MARTPKKTRSKMPDLTAGLRSSVKNRNAPGAGQATIHQHNASGEILHATYHIVHGLHEVLSMNYGLRSGPATDCVDILNTLRKAQRTLHAIAREQFGDTLTAHEAYYPYDRVRRDAGNLL